MPAIKITLNRLIELFGKSVNAADLPDSVRALAARLMTLTAHVVRVDQKVDVRIKALSEQIATLTDIVQALAQPQQGAPAAASQSPVESSAPAPAPTPAPAVEETGEEEEDEAAFFARAQQEAEAEVAAINANVPAPEAEPKSAAVTPLPRSKKVGGAK